MKPLIFLLILGLFCVGEPLAAQKAQVHPPGEDEQVHEGFR